MERNISRRAQAEPSMGKDVVVLGRKDRPWREAMDQTEKELRISLSCGNKPWGTHPQGKASLFVQYLQKWF